MDSRWMHFFGFGLAAFLLSGCYAARSSGGGAQTDFHPPRLTNPADIALPPGYGIEVVAQGLTFPTGIAFDEEGTPYVVESGYAYGEVFTTPRLLRIERDGSAQVIAIGRNNGPWNGLCYFEGAFFVAEGGVLEGGRMLRIDFDGSITVLVDGLPSFGDHHANGPIPGPDGMIYFGQGTASNSGVIGEDNAQFGWLERFPTFADVPGEDIILSGENFSTPNVIGDPGQLVETGPFLPFGVRAFPGQRIAGQTRCNGAVLRVSPEGGEPELVAWGFRNPFGLAFLGPRLYVTDNGYDDRGSRPVWGAPDLLWRVRGGVWYGWPDFVGGEPVTNRRYAPPAGPRPEFLLAQHPNTPPRPVARFAVHGAAAGLDFSRSRNFGYVNDAFVAMFGDESPVTGKVLHPVGFKVVRVNIGNGVIEDFAVNKGPSNGPASKIGGRGLERPVAVRFDPSGEALYIVDFGVMTHPVHAAVPHPQTGVIWRVRPL
jgi:hypothetical protein